MGAKPLKNVLNIATLGISGTIAAQRQATKDAADATRKASEESAKQAADLQTQIAQQPKEIAAEDYQAKKLKQLSGLRLGLGATMTNAGSLTSQSGLKTKLG
jgi:hypothetical protein